MSSAESGGESIPMGLVAGRDRAPASDTDEELSRAMITESRMAMRHLTENRGQFEDDVRFVAATDFGMAVFYDSQVRYLLEAQGDESGTGAITISYPGSRPVAPVGSGLLAHRTNYLFGDASSWITGVRNYDSVIYQDLWPGIDLVYRFDEGGLKYEFSVDAGVPSDMIKIGVEGAAVHYQHPNLVLDTGRGSLVDGGLEAIQDPASSSLSARFLVSGSIVSFQIQGRDLSRPLLIDPLVYSTYIGGGGLDCGSALAVDADGNAYIAGHTNSQDFTMYNPFQATFGGGSYDAFVLKLNASGSGLVYSTYMGGGLQDYGNGIAVDADGNAYVTGYTQSTDFPVASPFQGSNGGIVDAFVLKLSPDGSALVYSTYLGGASSDRGSDIAVDSLGNAYVTGFTSSTDFPTSDPYQPALAGINDAFVLKLNASGGALDYSTYIGGSSNDYGNGIAVDLSGNAYVAGYTSSTDFPTSGAYQGANAGLSDAFLLKLNASGGALDYSTYIGGGGAEECYDVAIDASGGAYITGFTGSSDFPTANAYQGANAGLSDVFVLKLDPSGGTLDYSTYIGGSGILGASGYDTGYDIAVDSGGSAYVTGDTNSLDFPTSSPLQASSGGEYDAFLLRLDAAGGVLAYSTYIGGGGSDHGRGIALGAYGDVYVTGQTESTDFPLSVPYQGGYGGGLYDAFVLRYVHGSSIVPSSPLALSASPADGRVVLTWGAPADDGDSPITHYRVYRGTSPGGEALLTTLGNVLTYEDSGLTNGQTYYYKVSALNALGEGSLSNEAFATPRAPAVVPSAPQNLVATPGDGQVHLAWDEPEITGDEELVYHLFRDGVLVWSGYDDHCTDTGLSNGQAYAYRVSANNTAGWGPNSTEVLATPMGEGGEEDDTWIYVVIGAVAILAIAGAAVVMMRRRK